MQGVETGENAPDESHDAKYDENRKKARPLLPSAATTARRTNTVMSAIRSICSGWIQGTARLKSGRIKRQYVWAKTGGFCWYCGARLYLREDADTELKKRLMFTVDHLHPRVHGGRGRANKVPACKYCNSHKSWRSVEQFREWVRTRLSGQAKNTVPRGWRINAEGVIFYFELAVLGRAEVQGAS